MNSRPRRRGWWLVTVSAAGVAGDVARAQQADLIEEGRRLFLEETFDGNGRTCATCHPPTNNFTIDPEFIRTLRANNPLFVTAPSAPDLNALEVKRLLKQFGLVLENVDGLDQPGVLRGVPHTLGLSQSLVSNLPGIAEATGWSGDGSPDDHSLRSFAVGAVIQHFTKSLNRVEGLDFRLPTDDELDALEAFQLSLGRQEEVNIDPATLDPLVFTDEFVEDGKFLFESAPSRNGNGRSCAFCHENAGANLARRKPQFRDGRHVPDECSRVPAWLQSARRRRVRRRAAARPQPFRSVWRRSGRGSQRDGAFPRRFDDEHAVPDRGRGHTTVLPQQQRGDDRGSGGILHHRHLDAVAGNAFVLTDEETNQIAALLRALNALENIRSSIAYSEQALQQTLDRAEESIELALIEGTDAIEVLTDGPVELFADTDTISLLEEAQALERQALAEGLPNDDLLNDANELKEMARNEMLLD